MKKAGKKTAPAKAKSATKSKSAKKSAAAEGSPEILKQIKAQHGILKKSIEVLKSDKSKDEEKQRHLKQFIGVLKMHSEAEEATIYPALKQADEDGEKIILEASEEHNLAKTLIGELEELDYANQWSNEIAAKAKVLAEIVEHHAEEEEEDMFPAARESLSHAQLQQLGKEFQQICESFNGQDEGEDDEVELANVAQNKEKQKDQRLNH